ncbi:hypothetical protein EVAR_25846_1 [Eumeta japonica]|uniref:Uncharacterized protein n=1 Tax=Eumeta variegata TaxID=151549 RepID=A0A4C1X6I0_EUMVA|nr:hypothetical protein EVAR_25846_1 [Eumeta japonica]
MRALVRMAHGCRSLCDDTPSLGQSPAPAPAGQCERVHAPPRAPRASRATSVPSNFASRNNTSKLFIPPRVPEKKGLDRRTDGRTDGQQSDPIRVPFFPFENNFAKKTIVIEVAVSSSSSSLKLQPGAVTERDKSQYTEGIIIIEGDCSPSAGQNSSSSRGTAIRRPRSRLQSGHTFREKGRGKGRGDPALAWRDPVMASLRPRAPRLPRVITRYEEKVALKALARSLAPRRGFCTWCVIERRSPGCADFEIPSRSQPMHAL